MAKAKKSEEIVGMMPISMKEMNDKYSEMVDKYEESVDNMMDEKQKDAFVDSMTTYMKNMADLSFMAMKPWVNFVCNAQISMLRFYESQLRKAEEMLVVA